MATTTRTWRGFGLRTNPLEASQPASLDDGSDDDGQGRRPWGALLVALVVAALAVSFAGQAAARMARQDLDARLFDAGAGTNAEVTMTERLHLSAYRAIAYADGFADALARLDARDIERRLTPVDANHGIAMIDIIDVQTRVVFAFRAEGAVRPTYRDRRDIDIVRRALAGETDQYGDRFSTVLSTEEGPLMATAGPVRLNDKIVGVLLAMTPLDEVLGRSSNIHGAMLTAYSLDRGDPMATTRPVRPRALGTALRTELADPARLPHATQFQIAGKAQREQIGALVVRHETVGLLGTALRDRSGDVARRVMLIAGIGMAIVSAIVAIVASAWSRDRYLRDPPERRAPLALPEGSKRAP